MATKKGAKLKPRSGIRFRAYDLVAKAVEQGVECGYRRAHKHAKPTPESLREHIYDAVMSELCDTFDFEPWWED